MTTASAEPGSESVRWRRASRLNQAGRAAAFGYDQRLAVRRLRQALAALGPTEHDAQAERSLRARILLTLAYSEAESGQTRLGLTLLDQAEKLLPYSERADAHGQRAILLRRAGREDEALAEYDRAFAALDGNDDSSSIRMRLLLNRSALFLATVQLTPARRDLQRCLLVAQSVADRLVAAKVGHNLALLDHLAGRMPAALRRFADAEVAYSSAAPSLIPLLRLDRARTLLAVGLFTEADTELGESMAELATQRASQDHAEAQYLRAEAALLDWHATTQMGGAERATDYARGAAQTFRRRGNLRWVARADLLALRARFAQLDSAGTSRSTWRRLAKRLDVATEVLRRLGMGEEARTAALVEQRCRLRAGDPVPSVAPVRRSDQLACRLLNRLVAAEAAYATDQNIQAERQLRRGLADLGRVRNLLGSFDLQIAASALGRQLAVTGLAAALRTGNQAKVFTWIERTRAQALLAHRRTAQLDEGIRHQIEELRGIELELHRSDLDGIDGRRLQVRRDSLRRALREQSRLIEGTGHADPMIGWGRFRQQLGDTAAIIFATVGGRVWALATAGRRSQLSELGPLDQLEELVTRLRADLDALSGRQQNDHLNRVLESAKAADAEALDRSLFLPLISLIADRPLLIVPTRSLITVPWSALPSCHGRSVTVAPSATVWARATLRSPAIPLRRAVLVAGPNVRQAATEVALLGQLLGEHEVEVASLTGSSATPAAALSAIQSADLAHFACHGHHAMDNVLFSRLELETGPLMGFDFMEDAHQPPPWVVLSACDVGLHDIHPGDESLGLASALLATGTATVVASVCRLRDETAQAVMTDFYQRLLSGSTPSAALAAATASSPDTGLVCIGAG